MIDDMIEIFQQANSNLLSRDFSLIESDISERAICGALMIHINDQIKRTPYEKYYVDVEYNRNKAGTMFRIHRVFVFYIKRNL